MRYLAKVSYDGSRFYGFQRQPDLRNVQSELEKALTFLNGGKKSTIVGAGRTDAGVHALGQRISFDLNREEDEEELLKGFNHLLPIDIRVLSIKKVDSSFNARHSSLKKVYSYHFSWKEVDPFESYYVAYVNNFPFDKNKFIEAMNAFKGRHKFWNFTSKESDVGDFIRSIDKIEFEFDDEKERGLVRLTGDSFMTYQVRMMVGAALRVSWGKEDVKYIVDKLNSEKRHISSFKAPAEGLYLEDVLYE